MKYRVNLTVVGAPWRPPYTGYVDVYTNDPDPDFKQLRFFHSDHYFFFPNGQLFLMVLDPEAVNGLQLFVNPDFLELALLTDAAESFCYLNKTCGLV